jgi:phosphohistidine phosphatase
MKTLYLIRHAKSDWAIEHLADIDRPLNTRGYKDAHTMSKLLAEHKIKPDAIITSSAIRAVSTALIFARNFNFNAARITLQPLLYNNTPEKYVDIISETDDKIDTLFLFAHNPTITQCANILTGENLEDVPTTGITGITNNCSTWHEFTNKHAKIIFFDYPKKL